MKRGAQIGNKNGMTHGMKGTKTYKAWSGMRDRCLCKTHDAYSYYGGRGIKICERWDKFENFLSDMGIRPEGQTLERINCNGDYEPTNCKWATVQEQNRNKTNGRYLEAFGLRLRLWQWADAYKIHRATIQYAVRHGETLEEFLTRKTVGT